MRSKLLIYKGKFEKSQSKMGVVGEKADFRESTKLFPNLTTDSDLTTQNSLRTVEIKHRIHSI
jgi:hypothetical protein